jgi:hypothetical protein
MRHALFALFMVLAGLVMALGLLGVVEGGPPAAPVSGNGSLSWGAITGLISNQTDLNMALLGKQASLGNIGGIVKGNGTGTYTATTLTECATIKNPSTGDIYPIWRAPTAVTIMAAHYLTTGGTSVVGQIQICDSNGANCVNTQSSDTTAPAGTNANGIITANSVTSGGYVSIRTTTVNGSITSYIACFDYMM